MLYSHLKLALRVLLRHRMTTAINVLGLSLALTVCTLVGLYVEHELGFDRFHEKASRTYVVWEKLVSPAMANPQRGARVRSSVEELARSGVSGVEQVVRVRDARGTVEHGDETLKFKGAAVDPAFLDVFDFPLSRGNRETALTQAHSVVLGDDMAVALFGKEDPTGRELPFVFRKPGPAGGASTSANLIVTGVLAPIPENSSIRPQILIPQSLTASLPVLQSRNALYLVLEEGADTAPILAALDRENQIPYEGSDIEVSMYLLPLVDMHWADEQIHGLGARGKIERVYGLLAAGVLILVIACVNFVNLSMARAMTRSQEIGVRKAVGAGRGQLVRQLLVEAVLVSAAATAVGMGLAHALMPGFAAMVEANLQLNLEAPPVLAAFTVVTIAVGLVSGLYPATVAARHAPSRALADRTTDSGKRGWVGNAMVCLQFGISALLVIGTLTIEAQIDYMATKDLGFDGDQVANISGAGFVTDADVQRLQQVLPGTHVLSVAGASPVPGWGMVPRVWDRDGSRNELRSFGASVGFVRTLGLRLVAGRDLRPSGDQHQAILVNETMAQIIGPDALGAQVRGISGFDVEQTVVGIVEDFHTDHMNRPILPALIYLGRPGQMGPGSPVTYFGMLARFDAADIPAGVQELNQALAEAFPGRDMSISFLDKSFAHRFQEEERWSKAFAYASGFAMGIACMGLLGMAATALARRTKEVGIRRALGATLESILMLLSREFVVLVVIGNVMVWPVAWICAERWLQSFAHRMQPDPWLFVVAGLGMLAIALLTVAAHVVRAARTQPIEALRYE